MNSTVQFGNARFTIITPHLIRMEYSKAGIFIDEETLFAKNRTSAGTVFNQEINGNQLTVSTDAVTVTYIDDGKPFSRENLSAKIHTAGMETEYLFGMENQGNLKGPIATLDGVEKAVDLPDGLLSRDGWYVVDDSKKQILKDGWIENRPADNEQDCYLFAYGYDYKLALSTLAYVSGKMALPRKYAFGSWYSRWWPYTDEEILEIVEGYDENDFPLDIMVVDMDWHYNDWTFDEADKENPHRATFGHGHANNLGWTGYSWNKNLIKDPDKLLKELHEMGIFVTLNDHPHDGLRNHEDQYPAFMKALGYNPDDKINLPYNAGDKKYMDTLFANVHTKLEQQGVDFWWVDWQQDEVMPTVPGKGDLKHLPWLNYYYYNHSQKDGKRGMGFSRWGGFGDQKHPVYFSGDTKATWDCLAFEVYFTVTSGNVGCFYWCHDTGGFFGERNPEMFVRWVQFCMTTTSLRVHSERDEKLDRRPWKWGDLYSDAMRKMFHLRSQLIPYIYSTAYEGYEKSLPMLRPMYLDYPRDDASYQNPQQYFFGDAFLCAPIASPGVGDYKTAKQTVWIPEGTYYNFFTGEKYTGGQYEISANLFTFPLLVKAGVPVPMQPYQHRMVSAKLEELIVRCYPGENEAAQSFTLYEDDGISTDYEKNICLKTKLTYRKQGDEVTLTIAPSGIGYDEMPKLRSYTIELPLTDTPVTMISCPKGTETEYDESERCNYIYVKNLPIKETIELVCKQ